MLFQVEMNVRLPQDLPAEKAEALKQTELLAQRAGAWRHLWRVGRYANVKLPTRKNRTVSYPVCRSFRSWTCGSLRSVVSLHLSTTIIDTFRIN